MSDNIPLEIQSEILHRLPVKSLLQFRSVCKPWKSLIDSSRFILRYTRQQTQTHRLLVTYRDPTDSNTKYVSIADDDTLPQHKVSYSLPLSLTNVLEYSSVISSSHGLLCLYGCDYAGRDMAAIWNPSVSKSVGVAVPNFPNGTMFGIVVGFGVCRETIDPKIVKITYIMSWDDMDSVSSIPSQVEVFSLSTGVWRAPYGSDLPSKLIHFGMDSVVIDGVLYWLASQGVMTPIGYNYYNLVMSFDLTSEEFGEIDLPDSLAPVDEYDLSISKLRNSVIVIRCYNGDGGFGVWMMVDGFLDSFVRIFTIKSPDFSVKGFRKNGELIIEMVEHREGERDGSWLVAYDPHSTNLVHLEMDASADSFCVHAYTETLLMLDHPDFVIYDEGKATLQSGEQVAFEASKQAENE